MSQIIKRPFRTFNGTDWDKHYFETSEDMINGAVQKSNLSGGYRVFPPGEDGKQIILQWGTLIVSKGGVKVYFPIAFPNAVIAIVPSVSYPNTCRVAYYDSQQSSFGITQDSGVDQKMSWIAIGY